MTSLTRRFSPQAGLGLVYLAACHEPEPAAPLVDSSAPVTHDDAGSSSLPSVDGSSASSASGDAGQSHPGNAHSSGADAAVDAACGSRFASSFEAIQAVVFEGRGCTAKACHGEAKVGGLDLRRDVAWSNLVAARSANSALLRVQAGAASESFLYLKLRAATEPGSVQVAGSAMPIGAAPLTPNELAALQLWITKGAPEAGNVSDDSKKVDVSGLLDSCAPPAPTGPLKAEPLPPPAADQGIQLVLPRYPLKGQSEVENCTPFAYDFTDKVGCC